ncbi:MAG: hypothetical protein ACOZAL_02100 [Patescibacteria group bacterium]
MFGKLYILKNGARFDLDGVMHNVLSIKGVSEKPRQLSVKIIKANVNFIEALSRKQLVVIELPQEEVKRYRGEYFEP